MKKGFVSGLALIGVCAAWFGWAESKSNSAKEMNVSKNAFIEVVPPEGRQVKWISEDDFILTGGRRTGSGAEKVTIRARPGWRLTQPKNGVMELTPGKAVTYAVRGEFNEDDGGGNGVGCTCDTHVSTNHVSAPVISLTNVTAETGGILVPNSLSDVPSVPVTIGTTVNVDSNGVHELITTVAACVIHGIEENVTTNKVDVIPSEFLWDWKIANTNRNTVGGSTFSTEVNVDKPGKHQVQITATATNLSCSKCACSASATTNALVMQIESLTHHMWPANGNYRRKKLGVGEVVTLGLSPAGETGEWEWTHPREGLQKLEGNTTEFVALYSAGTSIVDFQHIPSGQSVSIPYTIVEPSMPTTVRTAKIDIPSGTAGAGMIIDIYFPPHDVSFENVETSEGMTKAKNVTGYFADKNIFSEAELTHWPSGVIGELTHWTSVQEYQKQNKDKGSDIAAALSLDPPWRTGWLWGALGYSGGSMTWSIPAYWRVKEDDIANPLDWTDQIFNLTGWGTVTVQKFGHTVTRRADGNYIPVE